MNESNGRRRTQTDPTLRMAAAGRIMPRIMSDAAEQESPSNERLERFARNLDWNLLRTFAVVVQEGSITAAANRLLLQQPAVSMALKRLEQSVGQKLVDRRPGRFEVTDAGRKLYSRCQDIFGAIVRLPDVLASDGEEVRGHISVYTISHARHPAWDALLTRFFNACPRATISFTVDTTTNVIRAVERNVATLGLSDGVIPDRLSSALFARERYALYCGRQHPLSGRRDVGLDRLRGEPFVTFTADVLGGEHMGPVTALRAVGSFGQWVRAASSNVEEVRRMILANIGIGMLPQHLASPYVEAGDLWQLPPLDDLPTTEIHRVSNPDSIHNAAETAFLEMCAETPVWSHF